MTKKEKIVAYVVSDSIGQSAVNIVKAALSKYDQLDYKIKYYTFITEFKEIDRIASELKKDQRNIVLFYSFTDEDLADYLKEKTTKTCDCQYDILTPIVEQIGESTGLSSNVSIKPIEPELDEQYFDRISALEFVVAHDDGKEPKGFLEADIVILGISRTSKTPLSIYLANNGYKVANLPLVPEAELPSEIWKVNPNRIIGLTNDVFILSKIRKERMISYGLDPNTIYSNKKRIKEEIDYAANLYKKLDCEVINVANKSIEETAGVIIGHLNEEGFFVDAPPV